MGYGMIARDRVRALTGLEGGSAVPVKGPRKLASRSGCFLGSLLSPFKFECGVKWRLRRLRFVNARGA